MHAAVPDSFVFTPEGSIPLRRGLLSVVNADGRGQIALFGGSVDAEHLGWSADGRTLMFIGSSEQTYGQRTVVLLDVETGAVRTAQDTMSVTYEDRRTGRDTTVVAAAHQNIWDASWSPEGNRVFYSDRGDIYFVEKNGGQKAQVTTHAGSDLYPSASPDSRQVVFVSDRAGGTGLFVQDVGGGDARQVGMSVSYQRAHWSPDGTRIAFVGGGHIRTVSPDGSGLAQVTSRQSAYRLHGWSPNGVYLAFTADLVPSGFTGAEPDLYVIDVVQKTQERILDVAIDADVLWARR